MKLNLELNVEDCSYNVPSELVDVSIVNPVDKGFKNKHDIDEWTHLISINGSSIRIPSLDYLINKDLKHMLLVQSEFPWDNEKYVKRINRVILGGIVLSSHDGKMKSPTNSFLKRFGDERGQNTLNAIKFLISTLKN